MISLRLKEIAELIPTNIRVVDIGCDHALLDIYLAKRSINTTCLATDIAENSLEKAIFNIKKSDCENQIRTLLTSGLTGIELKHNDYIVISGMGSNTIIDIIKFRLKEINNIIIQSNHDVENLRKFMFENGFKIKCEKIVYDKRYYIIIHFVKGKSKVTSNDIWLGPQIKKSNNFDYFQILNKKFNRMLENIPKSDPKHQLTIDKISYLNELIEKKSDHYLG